MNLANLFEVLDNVNTKGPDVFVIIKYMAVTQACSYTETSSHGYRHLTRYCISYKGFNYPF